MAEDDDPFEQTTTDQLLATKAPVRLNGLALPAGIDYADPQAVLKAVDADPARIYYPANLAMEVALYVVPRLWTVEKFCAVNNLKREEWIALMSDETFKKDVKSKLARITNEGVTFRLKAEMQAEAMLPISWALVADPATPAATRAAIILNTIKAAGLDASKEQGQASGVALGTALNIQINLKE